MIPSQSCAKITHYILKYYVSAGRIQGDLELSISKFPDKKIFENTVLRYRTNATIKVTRAPSPVNVFAALFTQTSLYFKIFFGLFTVRIRASYKKKQRIYAESCRKDYNIYRLLLTCAHANRTVCINNY